MRIVYFVLLFPFVFSSPARCAEFLRIEEVTGAEPLVKISGKAGGRNAKPGDDVRVGEEITTVKGQVVKLNSPDGQQWRVAPESKLKIENKRAESEGGFWVLDLVRGAMWGKTEPMKKKDGFRLKVRTRQAAMGVRGTEYLLGGDEKGSRLDVLEGTVWWGTSMAFSPGSFKEVKTGERATLSASGKIEITKSAPNAATDYGLAPPAPPPSSQASTAPAPQACPREKGTQKECNDCMMEYHGSTELDAVGTCLEAACPRVRAFRYQCESCRQEFEGEPGKVGYCSKAK